MNEKYIKDIYDQLGGENVFGKYEDYQELMTTDDTYMENVYNQLGGENVFGKYEDYASLVKKKDESLGTSQEGVTEYTTGEDTTTTSSGSSEDVADDMIGGSDDTISVSELIDKTEGEALPYLRRELADNGFSLEETGMFGNAILVTDNITGEETEIDLKPIEFFGASKEDQIKKIQELRKQKTDPKRRFLSDINQLDDIKREDEGRLNAILSVGNSVPGVEVEYGAFGEVTVSKNGNSVTVNTEDRSTSSSQMMAQINKFLYDNLTEEEALEATQENTRQIIEDINEKAKKELKIDVSDEAVDAEFYGKDYFKNLFKFAESSDVEINIDEDEKKRLEEGVLKVISASYGEDKEFFNKESISNDIEKILENNPEAKELVEKYNAVERAKTIDSKIKRAKKLAKERVLEQHPRREQVKRVVDRKYDNLNESAKNTATTMEMAVTNYNNYLKDVVAPDLKKMMESDPELQVVVEQDDQGIVTGVMYNKETPELNKLIENVKNESNDLERLILKSDADLIKANAEMESVEGWIDATKRNYNIVDNAYIDLKNNTKEIFRSFVTNISLAQEAVGISGPMGMSQEDFRAGLRAEQEKDAELQQNYFETMRDYKEAYEEGSFGRFAFRQFSGEVPNMGLAIGMAYGGGAIGLSRATISTLTSTAFGLSAMGSKYNETTKRQEMAQKAEAALAELESVKDFMPKDDYYNRKYELERAKEDLDISSTDKTLAVVGSGLIEFGVSRFIGTVPNAAKIRSDFFKPAKYLDDINRSNVRAVLDSGWEITKRTAGGVIEETSIELLNQFNNYAFLGDNVDISQLDDIAFTSIITEGAMNVPSVAYSTLISQTNINRYREDVEGIVSQITNLQEALNDDSMPQGVRSIIHSDITSKIKQLSGITSNMEADALLLGADNLKNLLMLSGMEKSLFDQAGVESDDNYEAINLKVKNHLKTLDKSEAKKYQDKINYISKQRKEITGNLNYEGAIEKVFGDKGTKIAETLDDSLTAKEKYVEVYKQLREDVNKAAVENYKGIAETVVEEALDDDDEVTEDTSKPFVTEKKKEKVSDALNRPVTLTELGGSKLDAPIEGDLYVEGQQVVVEDSDGNITEIGNVDEISDSTLEDLGIVPQESDVKTDNEGNLVVNGETLVPNRKGIKKDKRGNVSRVVLRSPDGSITRTLRGANAEDAAYQILLKEAQSPEQSERVNQLLEQDEEFQNELRQTTESTETQADTDTTETAETEVTEVISSEYASSEIERLKELPTESEDGATMNLDGSKYEDGGLVIPVASVNMKVSELTVEAIEKFIKENSDSIGADNIKVGIYKFPNSDNASIDINIVADRSMRDEALKIGKELGQESLFDLDTFENIKTGADGKNPKTLTSQDFLDIQSRLTKKDGVSKLRDAFSKKPVATEINQQVENARKALAKKYPGIEILTFNSEKEYHEAIGEEDGSRGTYRDGKIFINPEKATQTTVAHEVFHAILAAEINDNKDIQDLMSRFVDALKKTNEVGLVESLEKLTSLIEQYNGVVNEEVVAELFGILASNHKQLKPKTKGLIRRFIDRLAKLLGLDTVNTESDIIDLLNTVSGKVSTGQEITSEDVSLFKGGKTVDNPTDAITRKSSTRKQTSDRPSIKEVLKFAEENNISIADTREYLKELGYTDRQIRAESNIVTKAEDIVENSIKSIKEKYKAKSLRERIRGLRKFVFDRQTQIKDVLKGIGNDKAKKAHNRLVTKAGAKGWASFRYKEAEKKIYKGLSESENKTLDALIYARRIVAVNENRQKRGMEPYVGSGGYTYDMAVKDVERLSNDKLSKRADEYFKVYADNLKRLFDSGRINQKVYEDLRDIEYSPIKTIKYIIGDHNSVNDINNEATRMGMTQKDIASLGMINENDIVTDSRWLLMMNINVVEQRAATNEMLRAFYDAIESATPEQRVLIKDFILDNPIIGTKKTTGAPKFKYDSVSVPPGYTTVGFYKNGVEHKMVIKEEYAKQLLDIKVDEELLKNIRKFTFGNVLRYMATGGNPLFIVGNTAVDFQNILFLGDTYSNFKLVGGVELAFDFTYNALRKVINTKGYKDIYREFMEHGGSMDLLATDGLRSLKDLRATGKISRVSKKVLLKFGAFMSYAGETSEVAFRVAVYEKTRNKLIKQYKKDNKGKEPTGQDLTDIKFEAARESRETIDFNQGGTGVKKLDFVLPYLNASVQGSRRMIDYASKNPVGFTSSMIQYTVMSTSLLAGSLYMLLAGMGDDDEEKGEKLKEAWGGISDYEKSSYHIIFTGNQNNEGEYEYYRVKKLPGISIVSTYLEEKVIEKLLKSKGVTYEYNNESVKRSLGQSMPISVSDLKSRNPLVSAMLTYNYNEDTFTGEKIFRGPRNKEILPMAEGLHDDSVENIYKAASKYTGMSPIRLQAAVEKITTNERTNPMMGLMYGAYDGIFTEDTEIGEEVVKTGKSMLESSGKKLRRFTNKKLKEYKEMDEVKDVEAIMETEIYLKEQKIYNEIKKKRKNGEKITSGYIRETVKSNFERRDWKKYAKKLVAYSKNANMDISLLNLIYEDTPEVQAYMLFKRYGDAFESEEKDELREIYRASRRKLSKKALMIYNNKYKK